MDNNYYKDAPSKLVRIAVHVKGINHLYLDVASEELQIEFSKIEVIKIGDSIMLENKNYKVINIIFKQHLKRAHLIPKENRVAYSEIDIEITLEVQH